MIFIIDNILKYYIHQLLSAVVQEYSCSVVCQQGIEILTDCMFYKSTLKRNGHILYPYLTSELVIMSGADFSQCYKEPRKTVKDNEMQNTKQ